MHYMLMVSVGRMVVTSVPEETTKTRLYGERHDMYIRYTVNLYIHIQLLCTAAALHPVLQA